MVLSAIVLVMGAADPKRPMSARVRAWDVLTMINRFRKVSMTWRHRRRLWAMIKSVIICHGGRNWSKTA